VPDPQAVATFERSILNWGEVGDESHARMLTWYRRLIELRRARLLASDAENGEADAWYDSSRSLLLYTHMGLLVCCNLGVETVPVPEAASATLLLRSDHTVCSDATPTLSADSAAIWSLASTQDPGEITPTR
jgi:maltooligosyltrehalose trehalohydrolase